MKEIFAPADDIADGEMYLRLAADMDRRIGELKARYKATGDMKIYYSIQDLRKIQREHRKTARHLLCRGERRRCMNRDRIHEYENERRLHNNEFRPYWTNGICFGSA